MDTLKETFGEVTQRCRVTSMRPAYGESKNATRLMLKVQDLVSPRLKHQMLFFSPNAELGVYESELSELREAVLAKGRESILSGDFNSKSAVWGM
nr:unnamed protein product [Callosobruchus analis]